MQYQWLILGLVILIGMSGCAPNLVSVYPTASDQLEITETPRVILTSQPFKTESIISTPVTLKKMVFTYSNEDGNRVVEGTGGLATENIEINLAGIPQWIVGLPLEENSIWYVVLETGEVQAFLVESDGNFIEVNPNISSHTPGMPPILVSDGNNITLVQPPADASPSTHPLLLENDSLTYIDEKGNLKWVTSGKEEILYTNALPDARIITDGNGGLLFLSNPTTSYPHGVLGDSFEATTITLIDTKLDTFGIKEIQIEAGDVIEGIAPLWVDLDGDSLREIIVTQSKAREGSRIVVYSQEGDVLAESEPIGQGFRWLHLIAATQIVNNDTLDLVVVRTPHIGGVLEIYELKEGKLEISTSLKGYSSHQIGSRNLDASLVTDMNGDNIPDIVLPDQSQHHLSALQITDAEWTEIWRVPLNGKLTTNLMGVYSPNSGLILGAGTAGNQLMLWVLKD